VSERRWDPLSERWVIVSPGRVRRPWQGDEAPPAAPGLPAREPDCHLCPGNRRAGGQRNPDYPGVFVFDNDFPALAGADGSAPALEDPAASPLLRHAPVTGRCRVLCYHPDHHQSLATLPPARQREVVGAWIDQQRELGPAHAWVQIFENRGRMMGCSSDHPHGQIWASDHVPSLPATEDAAQARYLSSHGRPLLLDYAEREAALGTRVVTANEGWLAVVPWWAAWPFETLLLPRMPLGGLEDLDAAGADRLAEVLGRLLGAYDALFGVAMPYSMGWHGRGRDQGRHWQLHAHFYPPLLRSATVRKFMVGYEMLAEAQRDLTPEQAAARLREVLA